MQMWASVSTRSRQEAASTGYRAENENNISENELKFRFQYWIRMERTNQRTNERMKEQI